MKAQQIFDKMKSELCSECNEIHLNIHKGNPHDKKTGGVWQSISEKEFEEVLSKLENLQLDEETSGWKEHLDRWESEGKISKEDRS